MQKLTKIVQKTSGWIFIVSLLVFLGLTFIWLTTRSSISTPAGDIGTPPQPPSPTAATTPTAIAQLVAKATAEEETAKATAEAPALPSSSEVDRELFISLGGMIASCLTALLSLFTFISTTALDWRQEARAGQQAKLEREQLQLELEKMRLELERQGLRRETGADSNRKMQNLNRK
jgi:hypothetical protein